MSFDAVTYGVLSKKISVLSEAMDELSEENAKLSEDKIALPKENGVVNQGTVGQFAVSDGKGGITWKTLIEAEEVSY